MRRRFLAVFFTCDILHIYMTKKLDYIIKLTYDKEYKGYVADVLNLYGCMSQGKTKKDAIANVNKAIKAYMEVATKKVEPQAELAKTSVNINFALN